MKTDIGFLGEFQAPEQEMEYLKTTWKKERLYTLSSYFTCCFLLLLAGVFADYQRDYAIGNANILTALRVGLVIYGGVFFLKWFKKDYSKVLEVHFTLIKFYSVFIVALMTMMTMGTSTTLLAGTMIMTTSFYVMLPGHLRGTIINCLLLLLLFLSLPLMNNLDSKLHFYQSFILVSLNIVLLFFRIMFNKAWRLFYISKHHLEEINQAKDDVLYTIAHDLKSPLQVIMTTAQLVSVKGTRLGDDEIEKYQERIVKAARKTDGLLSELLTWAMTSNESMGFTPVDRNIKETISDAIDYSIDLAKAKNIQVVVEVEDCDIKHDKNMIETCIRNILSNAIKFSPEGKTIKIEGSVKEHYSLHISDMGSGVPEVIIEGIKSGDSFHAHKGTNGETGSGIGLKLVHSFIEKHRGDLLIENLPDNGSRVSLLLPIE